MTKVLVTGGAGFIGSNLVDKLIEQNFEVFVIDNLSGGKKENINPAAKFFQLDICNYEKDEMDKSVSSPRGESHPLSGILPLFEKVEYVFHLAALPRVQFSIDYPKESHNTNVNGTLNVLLAAKAKGVKRVIYSSSSSIYGEAKILPIKEDTRPNPLSPYALHKLIGEYYCKIFSDIYGLETVSLRYFNVYGFRQSAEGDYATAIAKFIKLKNEGKPLTIFGDGEQTRDFTNVFDVVEANILAMKSDKVGKGEIINICSGKNYSVNQIADIIRGKKVYLEARKGEPRNTLGDYSLAKELLGWKPKVELEEGIRDILAP